MKTLIIIIVIIVLGIFFLPYTITLFSEPTYFLSNAANNASNITKTIGYVGVILIAVFVIGVYYILKKKEI